MENGKPLAITSGDFSKNKTINKSKPMNTQSIRSRLLTAVCALSLLVTTMAASATEPETAVQRQFKQLINAVESGDHAAFVAEGTPQFKATPPAAVVAVSKSYGARLKKGYDAAYLAELKQMGHKVYLWKLTFKDGGDDMIARMVMKDGKVAGFFFQ